MDHVSPPIKLKPHEVETLLATYWAHRRQLGEECICGHEACSVGAVARLKLWQAGINPDHHRPPAGSE